MANKEDKISEDLLAALSEFVTSRIGLYFAKERWRDLERGLRRACPDLGFNDPESCARWLLLSPLTKQQVETLASHLTVGETYFFRDPKMFDLLEDKIFTELIQERRGRRQSLRIWSAGCSTGEEAYSIAILLRRMLRDIDDWNITILATDINPSFLRKASQGVYGEWSFRDVVPSWLKRRYFHRTGQGRFEVVPDIRKQVTFLYHNLVEDNYPSLVNNTNAMDIILCRNVLMYFSGDRQRSVVEKLYHCLVDGGRLIVSPTESAAALFSPFVAVHFPSVTLYQKDVNGAIASLCPTPQWPPPFQETPATIPVYHVFEPVVMPPVEAPGTSRGGNVEPEEEVFTSQLSDLYQEALLSYERGCYRDAEEKIVALLNGKSEHAPALALLARIHANTGKLTDARELCEKAIVADKLNPGYYYLLATILQEMGMPGESAASLKRSLYLDQNFTLAHFALGNLALLQGKVPEAVRHFENALSAIRTFRRDDVLPESEGVTAGRMEEIIRTTIDEQVLT